MSSASADQRICLYDSDELDGVLDLATLARLVPG